MIDRYLIIKILILFFITSFSFVYSNENGLKVKIFKGYITIPSNYVLRNDEDGMHFFYVLDKNRHSYITMGVRNENNFNENISEKTSIPLELVEEIKKEDFKIKRFVFNDKKKEYASGTVLEKVIIFDDEEFIEILDSEYTNTWKKTINSYSKSSK
jgi:hypothetical protein